MPTAAAFVDLSIEPPVLAWLSAREFARARQIPGFALWSSHSEFAAERDALLVGYGMAGVEARRQSVVFEDFVRWCRLTGAPLDVDSLDEFAAHGRWRAQRPEAPVVGAFGAPGDPERNGIDAAGAQRLRIRPELYVKWRDEFARSSLLPAPSLDAYAAHVVECCFSSSRRTRRPPVRSS